MYRLLSGLESDVRSHFDCSGYVRIPPIADMRMSLIIRRMGTVFILQHERPETEDCMEDVKFIGAYSSEASAQAAVERLRIQPGFRDYPDDFTIDEYEVDKDHWTEGFTVN